MAVILSPRWSAPIEGGHDRGGTNGGEGVGRGLAAFGGEKSKAALPQATFLMKQNCAFYSRRSATSLLIASNISMRSHVKLRD